MPDKESNVESVAMETMEGDYSESSRDTMESADSSLPTTGVSLDHTDVSECKRTATPTGKKKKKKKHPLDSVVIVSDTEEDILSFTNTDLGITFKVGETVYVQSKKGDQPFSVCNIQGFQINSKNHLLVHVKFYYRATEVPDSVYLSLLQDRNIETKTGLNLAIKDPVIRTRELFRSEVTDTYPVGVLRGKCRVVHYEDIHKVEEFKAVPDTFFYIFEYSPTTKRLATIQGEIRVGPSHQAKLPECQPNKKPADMVEKPEDWEDLTWKPTAVLDGDLVMYLRAARSMAAFAGMCDGGSTEDAFTAASMDETTIKALDELHSSGYDTKRALGDLVKRINPKSYEKRWSEEDVKKFVKGLRIYGKNFFKIRKELVPNKETGELVEYYYYWKKTPAATTSRPHTRRRRGRKQTCTPTRQTSEECDASSASELSEGEDSEYSDTSSSRDITSGSYFCRNCYTRKSKDWHHQSSKNNRLLCTECHEYYEQNDEDRPVDRHSQPPHYLFQPVKDKRDLESPEGDERKSPSSDSVSSLSSSDNRPLDRLSIKQKREADSDDPSNAIKRSKPNERSDSPSESYISDSSSVFNDNEENGNEGDVETNQDDATSTESSSPNEEVHQKQGLQASPYLNLNVLPRPIPKQAQPGTHMPSQPPAHAQTLLGSQHGQNSQFQKTGLLRSPPSLIQSLQQQQANQQKAQIRPNQHSNIVHSQSGHIQASPGHPGNTQQKSSISNPGQGPPSHLKLPGSTKGVATDQITSEGVIRGVSHSSHVGTSSGQPTVNSQSKPIHSHILSSHLHPQQRQAQSLLQPLSKPSLHPVSRSSHSQSSQTHIVQQSEHGFTDRPIGAPSLLHGNQQTVQTSIGQPQPGVFTPSIQTSIKTEIKTEIQSEGTEDSESSSEKSSESEHSGDRETSSGDSASSVSDKTEVPNSSKSIVSREQQFSTHAVKKEPVDTYGMVPYNAGEHSRNLNSQKPLSGFTGVPFPGIKQEPSDNVNTQQSSVVQHSISSQETSNNTKDFSKSAAMQPDPHIQPQKAATPATSQSDSVRSSASPQQQHQHLSKSHPHHQPHQHPLPPGHMPPYIPPHLNRMPPHSIPLQIPQVPHPVRPQLLPTSTTRPQTGSTLPPGSSTLPHPPPLVSLPQSNVPSSSQHPSLSSSQHSSSSQALPSNTPHRLPNHPVHGTPSLHKQEIFDRRMDDQQQRGRSPTPRHGSPLRDMMRVPGGSPPRERSRSRSPLIRPESDSDSEPPRSPEPEAVIVNEQCHKSKNAIFIKHWNRGWNSCSRCDFEFRPMPDSKLARKREELRLRRRSSSSSASAPMSSIRDERREHVLKEEDRTAKKPETPPDNVTADAQITSAVMHSPHIGSHYGRLAVSPRPPYPHPLAGDRTPALNQLSAYARHNLAAPGPGLDQHPRGLPPFSLQHPAAHPHHPLDAYRLSGMYPPGSREHLELELEREKRERDARERELRERELREMELRETIKHEIEMKPPGFERQLPPGANPMDPYWAELMKRYSAPPPGSVPGFPQHLPGVYAPASLSSDLIHRERERLERRAGEQAIAERIAAERLQAERIASLGAAAAAASTDSLLRLQTSSASSGPPGANSGGPQHTHTHAHTHLHLHQPDPNVLAGPLGAGHLPPLDHLQGHSSLQSAGQGLPPLHSLPPGHPLVEAARQSELLYRDLLTRPPYSADPVLAHHQIATAQAAQAQAAAVQQEAILHRQLLERERLASAHGGPPPHLR